MSTADESQRHPIYLQVADRIREAIIAGELRPGDALPTERELAESFAVSRASVREALRALQAQGLVSATGPPTRTVVVPGAGEHAREALEALLRLNGVALADLMSFRSVVEGAAVTAAARGAGGEWLEDARTALAEMRSTDLTAAEYEALDLRFHMALVRGSGSESMDLVMAALRGAVALHLRDSLERRGDLRATLKRLTREHADILAAVEAHEADDAAALVQRHITAFYDGSATA